MVGPNGRVDVTAGYSLLKVRYRPFAEAVLAALPKAEYEPARIRGCPVPMQVVQTFSFAIRRRSPPNEAPAAVA